MNKKNSGLSNTFKKISRLALGGVFILTGCLHFISSDGFTRIVPGFLPEPKSLVYLSGIFEILGGLGLLIPKTRRLAAIGLAALLVAVFPANLNHAVNNIQVGGFLNSPLYQWLRLPLQPLLVWWVLWSGASSASIASSPKTPKKIAPEGGMK